MVPLNQAKDMKCLGFSAIWLAPSCSWTRLLDWSVEAFFLHIFSIIVIYSESDALCRSDGNTLPTNNCF